MFAYYVLTHYLAINYEHLRHNWLYHTVTYVYQKVPFPFLTHYTCTGTDCNSNSLEYLSKVREHCPREDTVGWLIQDYFYLCMLILVSKP